MYVSDGEHGVKAAFAEPAASIPVDETTGVEYGRFTSTSPNIDNLGGTFGGTVQNCASIPHFRAPSFRFMDFLLTR